MGTDALSETASTPFLIQQSITHLYLFICVYAYSLQHSFIVVLSSLRNSLIVSPFPVSVHSKLLHLPVAHVPPSRDVGALATGNITTSLAAQHCTASHRIDLPDKPFVRGGATGDHAGFRSTAFVSRFCMTSGKGILPTHRSCMQLCLCPPRKSNLMALWLHRLREQMQPDRTYRTLHTHRLRSHSYSPAALASLRRQHCCLRCLPSFSPHQFTPVACPSYASTHLLDVAHRAASEVTCPTMSSRLIRVYPDLHEHHRRHLLRRVYRSLPTTN